MPKKVLNDKVAKRFKVKQYILKTIHIITYILSVLFLIVCIVCGVQSCNKPSSVSAESINSNNIKYLYSINLSSGSHSLTTQQRSDMLSSFGLDSGDVYWDYYEDDEFIISYDIYDGELIYDDNEPDKVNLKSLNYKFHVYDDGDDHLYIQIIQGYFIYNDGDVLQFLEKTNTTKWNHPDFIITYINKFIGVYNGSYYFYAPSYTLDNFQFASQFNFNAPYRLNRSIGYFGVGDDYNYDIWNKYSDFISLNGAFNGDLYSPIPDIHTIWFRYISLGDFVSNGRLFNRIFYFYVPVDGFLFDKLLPPPDSGAYFAMAYYYGDPITDVFTYNDLTFVNYRNWSVDANNLFMTANYQFLSTSSWTNDDYRYITFIDKLSLDERDFLTSFNSNEFGGNGFDDITIISGGNGSVIDVFTLLGNAFASLQNFLSINILPAISIGTLLFLPLVVGIVITIFWLIKR